MISFVPKEFVVFAGLLAAPGGPGFAQKGPTQKNENDPRFIRLRQFFAEHNCPVQHLAADFLIAADQNDLDWRLLPSISLIESGGGKGYRNNNIFGWNSGLARFPSVRQGIHAVAARLASSRLYRGKSTDAILRTYNPKSSYSARVQAMMRTIGPPDLSTDDVAAALN